MINIIITEFQKLKRYSVLWVGIVAVLISTLLSVYQQTADINHGILYYEDYTNSVIWNNYSISFPFMIVLIGGYMINREYTDHTLRNILTLPISFRRLMTGKLISMGLVTVLYGTFSFLCTFVFGRIFCNGNMSPGLIAKSFFQIVIIGICCYLAVLPIIIFFSRKRNGFLAGVALAFVYGFCGIFIAGRNLTDYYPITAGLGLIGFTGGGGAGDLTFNTLHEICVLALMVIISSIMLLCIKNFDGTVSTQINKKDRRKKYSAKRA